MIATGMGTERADEFTLREWEQAWAHTRHLETMRGQYLGFFFTAVLGVTVVAGPRLADDSLRTPGDLLTVAALALGLELLSGFLYLAVSRLNTVLGNYQAQVESISTWMFENGAALDLALQVTATPPPRPWSGASGIARSVLKSGLLGLPFLSAGVLVRSIDLSGLSAVSWCCGLAVAASVGVLVWVWLGSNAPKRASGARKGPDYSSSSVPS
jgi:hypothetical protein